jgi:cysteine desulfuration protein SufE
VPRSSADPPLPPRLAELVEMLESLDRGERVDALISIAERFREVPERVARRPFPEERRVPGCESRAFVWSEERPEGGLDFHFAVENPQGISARALAVILADTLAGEPAGAIAAVPADVVERIFGRELSTGKSLGLAGMLQSVQREARWGAVRAGG